MYSPLALVSASGAKETAFGRMQNAAQVTGRGHSGSLRTSVQWAEQQFHESQRAGRLGLVFSVSLRDPGWTC